MKSNTDIRTAALNWWANQSEAFKALQFTQYKKETFTPANFHTELTGREIEAIFTDLGLSERAIKETTHITWWKGLNEEEQTKLCQKHFQGIPVESLMERSIKVMFHYENPDTTEKELSTIALEWWNGLGLMAIMKIEDKYSVGRNDVSRTEITNIYKAENPLTTETITNTDSKCWDCKGEIKDGICFCNRDNATTNTVTGKEGLHTKGEWIFTVWDNEIFGKHVEISCPSEQLRIAEIPYIDDMAKANANRIVNCVNNFDSLVSALKRIEKEGVKVLEEWTKGKEIDFKTICGAMVEVAQSVLNFKP